MAADPTVEAMDTRSDPDRNAATGPQGDRALLGLVRFVLTVIVLVGLVFATVTVAPQFVDEVIYQQSAIETDAPPAAGDHNPSIQHADNPGNTTYEGVATVRSEHVEDYVHYRINDIRAERGLDPLVWDGTIASVARAHSEDMADREYFAHDNPDGQSPLDRFETTADYCYEYGENIAQNWVARSVETSDGGTDRYRTAEELADGLAEQWMNSPPHRKAILTEGWDRGGVGVYITDEGKVFATHNFCTGW
ncbi:SCP-like extracellular [Halovivax asiaticus JCM 14624]|uniref:SCP-like extracellular n=1 Tax=Halovivax asiaticus JCM 14624 TaxID=1227490 RepID=M0BBY7_9EURY|nr:CAP domain-containing protein [Halovivax asiaticus]ELZ08426.1 SCP-like extracellular [Halovivax asiaticus JCM 14624]